MDGAPVRAALVTVLAVGVVAAALGGLTTGAPAVAGAAIGTVMVSLFFGLGALVVGWVAALSPAASLLVAVLTYGLQVVLLGVVLLALRRSGALHGPVDPRWLAGLLVAGTLVWSAALVRAHVRARQPVFDLPAEGPEADAR